MTDEQQQKNSMLRVGLTPAELEELRQNSLCCVDDKPVFLDDEGPSEIVPQGIYLTVRDDTPRQSMRSKIESVKQSMQLTPAEAEALLKDMKESSAWMKQELARRRKLKNEAIATLGLEGLQFTEEERQEFVQFTSGEISLDELRVIWDTRLPRR